MTKRIQIWGIMQLSNASGKKLFFEWDHLMWEPASQQVWHHKDPCLPLVKAKSTRHSTRFWNHFASIYKWNQSTVSTAKRLASWLPRQLILYIILSTAMNCMYMELEVQCTCIYDPNKCWFYISKTYCFCFLLTLNCENLAKQLLPLAMF